MIATRETTQTTVLEGSPRTGRLLSGLGLTFALAVSAVLNLWNLAQNGYGNLYYSVAVQSMLQSWHNFFFASYDAGGFITVDKPPVALWIQAHQRQAVRLQQPEPARAGGAGRGGVGGACCISWCGGSSARWPASWPRWRWR